MTGTITRDGPYVVMGRWVPCVDVRDRPVIFFARCTNNKIEAIKNMFRAYDLQDLICYAFDPAENMTSAAEKHYQLKRFDLALFPVRLADFAAA